MKYEKYFQKKGLIDVSRPRITICLEYETGMGLKREAIRENTTFSKLATEIIKNYLQLHK